MPVQISLLIICAPSVGSETGVGICIERSLEMVIRLLGILKAGGAYVPLDPNYPGTRLDFMMQDSTIEVCCHRARCWAECRSIIAMVCSSTVVGGRLTPVNRVQASCIAELPTVIKSQIKISKIVFCGL